MRGRSTHKHRAIPGQRQERVWGWCVTPDQCAANPERERAHNGVVFVDYCSCGAMRLTEAAGGRRNYGEWGEP